jgi:hypothetical protein
MTVALAVVALVHDAMWFWGLNQARFVPMVIALAAAVSSIGLAVAVVYSTPHIALSSLPPAVRWLLLGTLAGAMSFGLLAASDNLWFLGDFYFRMSAISSGQFVSAIPQAFPLERLLSGVIPDYLRLQTPDATLQYLRWKGAVIAGAYVLLAARLGAVLARQSWLVFAWIVVMNGMLCFFTGHPRPVAEMLVTGLATIASGVEVLFFKRRHWALALSMILLLLVHRSGLAFLPAYAYVMWTAWRSVTLSTSQRVALWLPIVIAVMLIPKALEVATTFDLVRHVTSVGSGGVGGLIMASIAPQHLADVANAGLAMVPLALLACPIFGGGGLNLNAHVLRYLRVLVGTTVLLGLVVHPQQGMFRDYDVLVPLGLTLAVASAAVLATGAGAPNVPRPTLVASCALSGWLALTALAVNHDVQLGTTRIVSFLRGPPARSDRDRFLAWEFLGHRHLALGDFAAAARGYAEAVRITPRFAVRVSLGWANLRAGDAEGAVEAYRSLLVDYPESAIARFCLASALAHAGDVEGAQATLVPLLALPGTDPKWRAIRRHVALFPGLWPAEIPLRAE